LNSLRIRKKIKYQHILNPFGVINSLMKIKYKDQIKKLKKLKKIKQNKQITDGKKLL